MPFSLSQIFGGWRRKEAVRRKSLPPSSTSDVESKKHRMFSRAAEEGRAGVGVKETSATISKAQSELAWRLIVSAHISEKATALGEASLAESRRGKYVFKVADDAAKHVLRRAIEDRYGVDVVSVNTIPARSKERRRGQILGKRSGFKKAVVTLKDGQTISEY